MIQFNRGQTGTIGDKRGQSGQERVAGGIQGELNYIILDTG